MVPQPPKADRSSDHEQTAKAKTLEAITTTAVMMVMIYIVVLQTLVLCCVLSSYSDSRAVKIAGKAFGVRDT